MKNIKRRAASIILAAAMITGVGTAATIPGLNFIPRLSTSASAANELGYINVSGEYKTRSSFSEITSSTTKLDGGWYAAYGSVTINSKLTVSDDTYIVLTDGCKLVVKGGIEVAPGVKFNVYSQENSTGSLYAGTSNGSNATADSGKCGIGGKGAKINLVGGNIYAVGGSGAYGIQGSDIHLYWTNPTDSIYASSFNGTVSCYNYFINKDKSTVCSKNTVISQGTASGCTLAAASPLTRDTFFLNNGYYVVADDVTVSNRMTVNGTVSLYLASGKTLRAYEGITVPDGSTLRVSGKGKLYAGYNSYTDDYNAGIGSEGRGSRAGTIIIRSGTVNAIGGSNAAGIGGSNANIEIDGGTVNATGGRYGAGIGTGYNDNGASIQILGGNVRAVGGNGAAGIGNGSSSGNCSIELSATNYDDVIYASSYSGDVRFRKTLYTSDGQVATKNNIAGKELTSQINAYTVTFESNGGTYFSPVSVKVNDYLASIPTPVRNGYTFAGWFTDKNCYYSFDYRYTRITSNLTLYAKWTTSSHTVQFSTGSGTRVSPIKVDDGALIPQFQDPTKMGYKFTGWYTDEYCRYLFNWNTRIYSDMILYAGWAPIDEYYTVTFDAGAGSFYDGTKTASVKVNNGDSALRYAPSVPNYIANNAEYAFDGWYYNNIVSGEAYYGEPITANTKLVAAYHWVRDIPSKHTVSFYLNNQFVDSQEVNDGDLISVNRFISPYSWKTGSGVAFDLYTPIYMDYDLYATNVTTYSVSIYVNGNYVETQTVNEGDTITMSSAYYTYEWTNEYGGQINDITTYYIYNNCTLHAITPGIITPSNTGSVFDGAGLIAIIAGGAVLAGGGLAAGIAIGKKKK